MPQPTSRAAPRASPARGAPTWHDAQARCARWVEEMARTGYGPHGMAKLVGPDARWLQSPASAMRELGPVGPLLAPYRQLVRTCQILGDQATVALLLAARLVQAGLAGPRMRQTCIQGFPLARRQALAVLDSIAVPDLDGTSVASAGAHATVIVRGLMAAARTGPLDLDDVGIVVGGPEDDASWLPGLIVPQAARAWPPQSHTMEGGVLVVRAPRGPPAGASIRRADILGTVAAHESSHLRAWVERVHRRGVALVVCPGSLGPRAEALRARGIHAWEDAPKDALTRLVLSTGAAPAAVEKTDDAILGEARISPWHGAGNGLRVVGQGVAWSLVVPATGPAGHAPDEAERVVRTAGTWASDRRAVPGEGQWATRLSEALRSAAPAVPGRMPMAFDAAADAFLATVHDLHCNAGNDPWAAPGDGSMPAPGPAGAVLDVYGCVRQAVTAAFETAQLILRVDAVHARAPSSARAMRGSDRAPGPGSGMPADIPPLM